MSKFFFLIALIFSSSLFAIDLTPEQQVAKERGIAFYHQHKPTPSVPYLTQAAEAGDAEAQYYLGEALRIKSRHVTAEAQKWFEAAAAQDDLYAMLRLERSEQELGAALRGNSAGSKTPKQWREQAREMAAKRAEQGDAEAMYILYLATGDRDWLVRSAETGFPQGQYLLADIYKSGEGVFFWPSARQEAIDRWMKEAAEGGHPRAMMEYAFILQKKGELASAREFLKKAAATGYQHAVIEYGAQLAHRDQSFQLPLDTVKGYGIIYNLLSLDGGGGARDYATYVLPELEAKMTPDQIEEGKKYAEQWKSTHAPLSYFIEKLHF